jgi:guanine deaminase
MEEDRKFLQRAVEIASEGIDINCGPFGAVIVKDGKIIAEASNRVVMNNDPTAHAEVLAIRIASEKLGSHVLTGCIIYASCEPCPMCLGAIYWSGITRVVYAADRKDAAAAGFNDNFIYDEIMIDPARRKVSFVKLEDPASKLVFRKWEDLDEKIRY